MLAARLLLLASSPEQAPLLAITILFSLLSLGWSFISFRHEARYRRAGDATADMIVPATMSEVAAGALLLMFIPVAVRFLGLGGTDPVASAIKYLAVMLAGHGLMWIWANLSVRGNDLQARAADIARAAEQQRESSAILHDPQTALSFVARLPLLMFWLFLLFGFVMLAMAAVQAWQGSPEWRFWFVVGGGITLVSSIFLLLSRMPRAAAAAPALSPGSELTPSLGPADLPTLSRTAKKTAAAVVLMFIGLVIAGMSSLWWVTIREVQSEPTASATVLATRITPVYDSTTSDGTSPSHYRLEASFKYLSGGQEQTAWAYELSYLTSASAQADAARNYAVGSVHVIRYDPKHPDDIADVRTIASATTPPWLVLFGIGIMVCGAWWLNRGLRVRAPAPSDPRLLRARR